MEPTAVKHLAIPTAATGAHSAAATAAIAATGRPGRGWLRSRHFYVGRCHVYSATTFDDNARLQMSPF
jgi:hypothetical protein